jgi:ribosome-binding protein aMBF1 (putative translation factor)
LGLAQIGFQTVLSPHFQWLFLLTKSVFTPSYGRFRELLIEARENAGLTQWQLSERLKRPQSYVSKFERGERRLDVVEFLDVARALRVDPLDLLRQLIEKPIKRARENPA